MKELLLGLNMVPVLYCTAVPLSLSAAVELASPGRVCPLAVQLAALVPAVSVVGVRYPPKYCPSIDCPDSKLCTPFVMADRIQPENQAIQQLHHCLLLLCPAGSSTFVLFTHCQ